MRTRVVYAAVILITASNAVKGTIGLYSLSPDYWNLAASIMLSVGVEVLLFYSVFRWSADRTVPTAIYSSLIAVGAALLNFLFFVGHELAIPLALVGPVAACIGGLVVGEGERNATEERRKDQEFALAIAEEGTKQAKANSRAEYNKRKAAEAAVVNPQLKVERKVTGYTSKKEHILSIMQGKTPQEVIAETGYGQSYVYQVMRGENGRD